MIDHTTAQLDLLAAARQAGFEQGMERAAAIAANKPLPDDPHTNKWVVGYEVAKRHIAADLRAEIDPPTGAGEG